MPQLDTRCVILTGEGTIFSAGYDIGDLPESVFADEAEKLIAHPFAAAIDALDAHPYPTLAVLNGHAIGGGLELALSCDLRIAADGDQARDAAGEARARLLAHRHPQVHRRRRRRAHAGAVPARPADRRARPRSSWGLVNEVAPADELDERGAGDRRASSPATPRWPSSATSGSSARCSTPRAALDPHLEAELIALRRACFSSADFREGVRAFAEKRPPRWQGRDVLAAGPYPVAPCRR